MSYDVYMRVDTGGPEPVDLEPVDGCGNYTSNVSGMWTRCLTAVATREQMRWAGDDVRTRLARHPESGYYQERARDSNLTARLTLRDLDGKTGAELAALLRSAVAWGCAKLDELHEDDPPNGWGDADGAVAYLRTILRMCEQHPRARLHVSS